jgi:hypothetical protein
MHFNNIPNYKFEHNGKTVAGEKHGNFLFTDNGCVQIPEGVVIEQIPIENITQPFNPYCTTRQPETGFEIFQFEKNGNFIADTEDLSDEERQSESNERYIQFNIDK